MELVGTKERKKSISCLEGFAYAIEEGLIICVCGCGWLGGGKLIHGRACIGLLDGCDKRKGKSLIIPVGWLALALAPVLALAQGREVIEGGDVDIYLHLLNHIGICAV